MHFVDDVHLQVANVNTPAQVVLSGHRPAVLAATAMAKARFGVRRVIWLPVSAPFHCSLMAPAAARVLEAMEGMVVSSLTVPMLSNGEMVQDAARVRSLLIERITQPVFFHASLLSSRTILGTPPTSYIELGAGSVLTGLASKFAESEELDVRAVALPGFDAVRHFLAASQAPPAAKTE